MSAGKLAALIMGGGVQRVGITTIDSNNPHNITFPAGSRVGDLALILVADLGSDTSAISGGAGGWTKATAWSWSDGVSGVIYSAAFSKVLEAGDLAGVTATGHAGLTYGSITVVYRGPTTATLKNTHSGTAPTLSVTGFTKNASCRVVVSFLQQRAGVDTPSISANLGLRAQVPTVISAYLADAIPASLYTSGTQVDWTGLTNNGFGCAGALFELI